MIFLMAAAAVAFGVALKQCGTQAPPPAETTKVPSR
jgi:hypothetical protein